MANIASILEVLFLYEFVLNLNSIRALTLTDHNDVSSETDYSTSITHLKLLARHEQKIIEAVSKYAGHLEEKVKRIKRYIQDYTLNTKKGFNSTMNLNINCDLQAPFVDEKKWMVEQATNHFSSFQMLRRIALDLPKIEMDTGQYISKSAYYIVSLIRELPDPSAKDRRESIASILNLVNTYGLKANEVRIGKLLKLNTKSGLSKTNFFELGYYALDNQMYSVAIDFFQEALLIHEKDGDKSENYNPKFADLLNLKLNSAIKQHDHGFDNGIAEKKYGDFFSERLVNSTSTAFKYRRRINTRLEYAGRSIINNRYGREMYSNFDKLCRQQHSEPLFETLNDAKCFIYSKTHPFWILSPLKIEVLHKEPLIMQIYDVITKKQIKILQNGAQPTLARSRVFGNVTNRARDGGDDTITFRRSSLNAWLSDGRSNTPYSFVNDIVAGITGLSASAALSSEPLQVANYATGAQYVPHIDALHFDEHTPHLGSQELFAGDRLATFMIYLNNPGQGGATAFPFLGVVAKPKEGSALFWYNLHSNGTINELTVHGGCPILYGNKWVANKWIRANNQMFSLKCAKRDEDVNYFYRKFFEM